MSQAIDPHTEETNPILRRPALVCGAAVLGVLALVLASPFLPSERDNVVMVAVAERELHFADRADGAVVVTEAGTNHTVAVVPPGEGGFIRGTLRGLARERQREDIGTAIPFRLTAWRNGQVTLQDLATGRSLELSGFGPANAEAFRRFVFNRE